MKPHKKRGIEEEALVPSTSDGVIEFDVENVLEKAGSELDVESETRSTPENVTPSDHSTGHSEFKINYTDRSTSTVQFQKPLIMSDGTKSTTTTCCGTNDPVAVVAVDVTPRCFKVNDENMDDIIIDENGLQHRNESSWSQMSTDCPKEKSQVPHNVEVGSPELAPGAKLSPWRRSPFPRFHVQEEKESEVEPPLSTKWIFAQGIQLSDADARVNVMCTKGYWHYQKCKVNRARVQGNCHAFRIE